MQFLQMIEVNFERFKLLFEGFKIMGGFYLELSLVLCYMKKFPNKGGRLLIEVGSFEKFR